MLDRSPYQAVNIVFLRLTVPRLCPQEFENKNYYESSLKLVKIQTLLGSLLPIEIMPL